MVGTFKENVSCACRLSNVYSKGGRTGSRHRRCGECTCMSPSARTCYMGGEGRAHFRLITFPT